MAESATITDFSFRSATPPYILTRTMRVAVFSTKEYDRQYLREAVAHGASGPHGNPHGRHELTFLDVRLGHETAPLAAGYEAVCLFVNDVVDARVAETLSRGGTRLVALRCAGFNNVDARCDQRARHHRRARAGLFAACRGGAHRGADALAQSQDSSRLQPRARRELRDRRPARLRFRWAHRRRGRHGEDRRGRRADHARLRLPRHRHGLVPEPVVRGGLASNTCRSSVCCASRM